MNAEQCLAVMLIAAVAVPAAIDALWHALTERRARNRRTVRFADRLGVRS